MSRLNILFALPLAGALLLSSCGDEVQDVVQAADGPILKIVMGDTLVDNMAISFEPSTNLQQTVPLRTDQRDWDFRVVEGESWCTASKAGGLMVSVAENAAIVGRNARIELWSGDLSVSVNVVQKAAPPSFRLNQTSISFPDTADAAASEIGYAGYLAIDLRTNLPRWTSIPQHTVNPWYSAAEENGKLIALVTTPNTSVTQRIGRVWFNTDYLVPKTPLEVDSITNDTAKVEFVIIDTLKITQEGKPIEFSIDADALTYDSLGVTGREVSVATNLVWGVTKTSGSSDSWYSVTKEANGIKATLNPNATAAQRTGKLWFTTTDKVTDEPSSTTIPIADTIRIVQTGRFPVFGLANSLVELTNAGQDSTVAIATNLSTWATRIITSNVSDWFSVLRISNGSLRVTTQQNATGVDREAKVVFTTTSVTIVPGYAISDTLTVRQTQ
jgi:hypothetical protein